FGNITMEKEPLILDAMAQAMAAHNNKGLVIAQVERIVADNSLSPKSVKVPGILVDCVVVADPPEMHRMNYGVMYNPALSGEVRVPVEGMAKMPLNERKIIARRAAFELPPNGVINLGVGAPDGIAAIANEEKVTQHITMTTEAGAVGGVLAGGSNFGSSANAHSIIDQNQMFDFYDGGGLDMTCLGMAECDEAGNVNTSRFAGRLNGCGGFINISQNARAVVFAGTFTAGGLEIAVEGGKLRIVKEGRQRKFVKQVEEATFSGDYAKQKRQPVIYVTERCVFELTPDGLELVEVAPGIDIEKDIIAHMDFKPIVKQPIDMDPRIFIDEPMNLADDLFNVKLAERIEYDPDRNALFVNLEGWSVRKRSDMDDLKRVIEVACKEAGRRVHAIVNLDGFRVAEDLVDDHLELIEYLKQNHYISRSRYTTSAFMRMKMQDKVGELERAPHIFSSEEKAHAAREAAALRRRLQHVERLD
ncbi:MAG: acyl CoA:acetate/3-ketoacid CoA transferase, partial [Hyphomicrobiaceae bacterium]